MTDHQKALSNLREGTYIFDVVFVITLEDLTEPIFQRG